MPATTVTNYETNGSRELNVTGVTAVPGTSGTATVGRSTLNGGYRGTAFARTTWTVATTVAGGGDYDTTDGLTAGVSYYFTKAVRSSKIQRVQLSVVWLNAANAVVGATALGTQTVLATATWAVLDLTATAPATATQARIFAVSVAGTSFSNWVAGNTFDTDAVLVTEAANSPITYADPTTDPRWAWTGAANASTSYTRTGITATTLVRNVPDQIPGVLVNFPLALPTAAALRIDRIAEGRTFAVRGSIGIPADTPVLDLEAPFNIPLSYRAEQFADAEMTISLGFTDSVTTTLPFSQNVIHSVLDPSHVIFPDLETGTAAKIGRRLPGEKVYSDNADAPRRIGQRRRALEGLDFIVSTNTLEAADTFESMFGGYGDEQPVAIVCIRTPGPAPRIPRLLFASSEEIVEEDVSVEMGGELINWPLSIDEVRPPAPGLGVSILSYDDIDYNYLDYDAMDAAYVDYQAKDTDYSLAGTAP